jgi:hypothetical protein
VWAAYNAGPGKINRAIERTGSKDFWVLAKSGTIRDETANYVPKLLAAAIIGKHPERYGFGDGRVPGAARARHGDGRRRLRTSKCSRSAQGSRRKSS